MPRVHTQKAGKDYPEHDIKKGDTYYSWSFFRGPTHKSKTYPKGSQLTQRDEIASLCLAQEVELSEWIEANRDALAGEVEEMISHMQEAASAAQDKYDNLPENFQQAEQGQNLENFASECDDVVSSLETIRDELQDEDTAFDDIENAADMTWPDEF